MITRVEGKDWIVLQSEGHKYNIQSGQVLHWADSFCFHMVEGKESEIVPCCEDFPVYVNAPISHQISIKSYIGQPIFNEDGSIFGTLFAIDSEPNADDITQNIDLIELLGDLLSKFLQAELRGSKHLYTSRN